MLGRLARWHILAAFTSSPLSVCASYNGIPGCDGPCPLYDNDGVCNVPGPCVSGTDCADCQTIFPIFEIVAACLSFSLVLIILGTVCYYQRLWDRSQHMVGAFRKFVRARATEEVDHL